MIPFFVADRPMSLRIIKGLPLDQYPNARIGIMAHANTSTNFQKALNKYPCENFKFCDAVGGPCQFRSDIIQCPHRQRILDCTVKMCDSGIFTKQGATLTYQELFATYSRMGVEYGVMIDVFRDAQATIDSAAEALQEYEPYRNKFKLVVVAQGITFEEYIDCYDRLKEMGFAYIAVGGLLHKVEGTARYAHVRNEEFMDRVLNTLRERYPNDWLFALGAFNPSRQAKFEELNVWGDYKGWIFQYKKRDESLNEVLQTFTTNHLSHLDTPALNQIVTSIQNLSMQRDSIIQQHQKSSSTLNKGRTNLKKSLRKLFDELEAAQSILASPFSKLINRGLLDASEENLVDEALEILGKAESNEANKIRKNIQKNRQTKQRINETNIKLERLNQAISQAIVKLANHDKSLSNEVLTLGKKIVSILESSEQEHRLAQVRANISDTILAVLDSS